MVKGPEGGCGDDAAVTAIMTAAGAAAAIVTTVAIGGSGGDPTVTAIMTAASGGATATASMDGAATGDVFKGIAEPGWEVAPRPFRVRNIGEDIWLQAASLHPCQRLPLPRNPLARFPHSFRLLQLYGSSWRVLFPALLRLSAFVAALASQSVQSIGVVWSRHVIAFDIMEASDATWPSRPGTECLQAPDPQAHMRAECI